MTRYPCCYFSKGKNIDANDVLTVLRDMGIEFTEQEEEALWDVLPIHGELSKCLIEGTGFPGVVDSFLNLSLLLILLQSAENE
jgi:hypothetical protein